MRESVAAFGLTRTRCDPVAARCSLGLVCSSLDPSAPGRAMLLLRAASCSDGRGISWSPPSTSEEGADVAEERVDSKNVPLRSVGPL